MDWNLFKEVTPPRDKEIILSDGFEEWKGVWTGSKPTDTSFIPRKACDAFRKPKLWKWPARK